MMMAHVDQLGSLFLALESSFENSFRTSHECHHSPVGSFARIDVQHFYGFLAALGNDLGISHCRDDLVNDFFVPSLTVVRYAFNDSVHILSFITLVKLYTLLVVSSYPRIYN